MPRRKPDPTLELSVEEITPAIAEDWLQHNTHNRKISDKLVYIYAETMSEGEWRLNGEGIIFDKTGRLQSGQHRLLAVIEAGVTISSVVVRGAEPENIYSLESGRRRLMTDVLTLKGEIDVANLAAALSWTWRWENHLMDRQGERPTHTHQLRVLEKHPELREELAEGRRLNVIGVGSAGFYAALFHQLHRIDAEDARMFWDHIATGEELRQDHPCYAWRRYMINVRNLPRDRVPAMPTLAALTVKAWNKYRLHETVRQLSWKPEESFPEAL